MGRARHVNPREHEGIEDELCPVDCIHADHYKKLLDGHCSKFDVLLTRVGRGVLRKCQQCLDSTKRH